MSRVFLVQDWVTIRGGTATSSIGVTQDEEQWLDLAGFADAACWIDVAEVTPPAGSSANWLTLSLETSSVCDEAYFGAMAPPVNLGTAPQFFQASATPLVVRGLRSPSSSNLMRYLRWRIAPSAAGVWDLTFRIRAAATRTTAFVPSDVPGCKLWLRADAGITLNSTTVSQWNDLSGNGANVSQSTSTMQPAYAPMTPGVLNGLPALSFDQTQFQVLASSNYSYGGPASIFSAVHPTTGSWLNNRILETLWSNGYLLAKGGGGTFWEATIDGTFGSGGGTSVVGDYVVSLVFDGSTGVVYQNGSAVVSNSFPSPSPTSNPFKVGGFPGSVAHDFWNGYIAEAMFFNRAVTTAERTRIHRYLGARYGLSVP